MTLRPQRTAKMAHADVRNGDRVVRVISETVLTRHRKIVALWMVEWGERGLRRGEEAWRLRGHAWKLGHMPIQLI